MTEYIKTSVCTCGRW